MTDTELRRLAENATPCPFCGEVPSVMRSGKWTQVSCNRVKCLIRPQTLGYTRQSAAIRAWNRRKEPSR